MPFLLISTGFLSLYYVFHINVLCQSAFPNTLKLQLLLILASFCPLSQVHYFPEAFHYLTIHTYTHTHILCLLCHRMHICVPNIQWGQINWVIEVWSRERFIAGPCKKDWSTLCHAKTPNSSKGFSKALLKARWGRVMVSCCKLLHVGILCSCSCPRRSDHSVSVNFQQDKCYSLFWKIFYLYMNGLFRGQSPGNRLSCTFQDADHILLQKVQSKHDSARAIGPLIIWSQICSSLFFRFPLWGCKLMRAQDFA